MLRTFKSRVVRRTFWLIKVVPTWKKFEKRWSSALWNNSSGNMCPILRTGKLFVVFIRQPPPFPSPPITTTSFIPPFSINTASLVTSLSARWHDFEPAQLRSETPIVRCFNACSQTTLIRHSFWRCMESEVSVFTHYFHLTPIRVQSPGLEPRSTILKILHWC
jgi:hypothetical protein